MENKQSFSVEITLSVTNLMKIMDLSGKLGLVLGTNPVWKDGYVIYSDGEEKFPQPRTQFKVTGFRTGIKFSLYPEQVYKIIVEEDEKPKEVVHDQDEELTTSDAGSTRVTLADGREIEVEEDFDEVNVRWNAAFYGADYEPPVLSLTEKDTGSRLAVLAQNIEMLEEL